MEVVERFQGHADGEGQKASSAMDRILQRSKDRLSEKRQREVVASAAPVPKPSVSKGGNGQKIGAKTISNSAKSYVLTETPEEKKERKAALKQARNERRAEEAAAAASGAALKQKNIVKNEDSSDESIADEPVLKKKKKTAPEPRTTQEGDRDEEVAMEVVESQQLPSSDETAEPGATSVGIAQQLFPKSAASSGKADAQVAKAAKKGIEVEDVIETAYISAEMTRLPVDDAVAEWNMDSVITAKLKEETDVEEFFPVQTAVIPVLLRMGALECICPRDVCVAAPTGSGKTLAYALPILQTVLHRRVTRLRAVVLLPGRELVTQVYKVFMQITKNTDIKVGMATGHTYFPDEQKFLSPEHALSIKNASSAIGGFLNDHDSMADSFGSASSLGSSSVDILVCTPGRLVDHIQFTKGFTLEHLRYLVLDEADRLLGNASDHWIRTLIKSVGTRSHLNAGVKAEAGTTDIRLGGVQLLLFSATFTDNPRKLAMLGIHAPLVIRVGADSGEESPVNENEALAANLFDENQSDNEEDESGEPAKKQKRDGAEAPSAVKVFNLPHKLREMVCVGEAAEKPLQLAAALQARRDRGGAMALVFASSIDTTHRLCRLLQLLNGQCGDISDASVPGLLFGGLVREMSSLISSHDREVVMNEAAAGKVKVLISSDHLARGIDLSSIDIVINYDPPKFAKTYVHRVGRTARANRDGESITMLKLGQIGSFNKMRQTIGGGAVSLRAGDKAVICDKFKPDAELMVSLKPMYGKAIRKVQAVLADEQAGVISSNDDVPSAHAISS